MNEIRNLLCEEIDALRAKTTTAANVNAVVNATGKILTTIKMEMEYAKSVGRQANMKFIELEDAKFGDPISTSAPVVGKEERAKAKA